MVIHTQHRSATNYDLFSQTLANCREQIDARIEQYSQQKLAVTSQAFGPDSAQAVDAYLQILNRGGKRIRAALTMSSYQMFGGKNKEVALQAALVMEMIQAYLLIIDDVCDRSELRRGGPTAHRLLATVHHQAGWQDGSLHFGQSIATLAAILGLHEAMIELDTIKVSKANKLAAIRNVNQCLTVTAHGQFNDMYAQVKSQTDIQAIENVLIWKTAYYTFINPLQFGALLAGATEPAIQSIVDFGIHAGKAFQLTDDLIGTFSPSQDTGKSQRDDIKEGKRTLQIMLSLQLANKADSQFLTSMLGNQHLTREQLDRCRYIIKECGAYSQVISQINHSLGVAQESLGNIRPHASEEGIAFLSGLLVYLESRHA